MLAIALKNMEAFAASTDEKQRWKDLHSSIKSSIKEHLWDPEKNKFIPHLYLNGSPFPGDFDENAIHFHGGTAMAIEAGILNQEEIAAVLSHMIDNVKLSGAPSIGLTVYPPYPGEVLGENISPPYRYQNKAGTGPGLAGE